MIFSEFYKSRKRVRGRGKSRKSLFEDFVAGTELKNQSTEYTRRERERERERDHEYTEDTSRDIDEEVSKEKRERKVNHSPD